MACCCICACVDECMPASTRRHDASAAPPLTALLDTDERPLIESFTDEPSDIFRETPGMSGSMLVWSALMPAAAAAGVRPATEASARLTRAEASAGSRAESTSSSSD